MMLSIPRTAPLLCVLFATRAFAGGEFASPASGGTVQFSGQIVEPVCETAADTRRQQLEMRCQRSEGTSVETWSLASLTGAGTRSTLASLDIRYLDPQNKLAILTVRYD